MSEWVLTLCLWETTKQVSLQTVKTKMKCCIMPGSTLFAKVIKIFRQKMQYLKQKQKLIPLDMYNGLSQVYCIKPEARIHYRVYSFWVYVTSIKILCASYNSLCCQWVSPFMGFLLRKNNVERFIFFC